MPEKGVEMTEKRRPVIYGLLDKSGDVFYVGKTVNLTKRMAAYKSGRFHGNRALAAKIEENGLAHIILRSDCEDINAEEFAEIQSRSGLVNLITSPRQPLRYAKSNKPWVLPGVTLPSTAYMRHMRNAFGVSCKWMKDALNAQSDEERVKSERRIAENFSATAIGNACSKWMRTIDGRA